MPLLSLNVNSQSPIALRLIWQQACQGDVLTKGFSETTDMRLAYLAHWAEGAHSGVTKKIRTQICHWQDCSHDVVLVLVVPACNREEILKFFGGVVQLAVFEYKSLANRYLQTHKAANFIRHWRPDLIYGRQMPFSPDIHALSREIPLVVEVNTNDFCEFASGRPLRRIFNKVTRRMFYASCQGLVFVTRELANSDSFRAAKCATTVIANGIDLRATKRLPPSDNSEPTLIFVGSSGQRWHGVDKLKPLAQKYPAWTIHLVGPDISDVGHDIPDNMILHGHLRSEAYEKLLAQSDIGIGTLALHRKGMDEACPLKVREYLSHGLPAIIAYQDTDFTQQVPYLLRLENIEDNIDATAIESFASEWLRRRINTRDLTNISISDKEDARLEFMRYCTAQQEV